MPHYQLRCEMIVARPIDEVFAMFENPHNLALLTPPSLHFRVTSPHPLTMRRGAEIDYRFRWLGLPMHWRTRITSYEQPVQFVDEALRSPYHFWRHLHTFESVDGATRIRDAVDYQLPFGPLGRAVHSLAVRRNLLAIFTFRQQALDLHWGGGAVITWPTIRWLKSPPAAPGTASPEYLSR